MTRGEMAGPAASKVLRLLCFVGAGLICSTVINKWRELERKSVLKKQQDEESLVSETSPNVLPVKNDSKPQVVPQNPPPVMEPLKFSCPICIGPLNKPTTTRCGHIFCTDCIEAAIAAHGKCPTCRKKLGKRNTFRVYLPSLN